MIKSLFKSMFRFYIKQSPKRYHKWLKHKGVRIGDSIYWGTPKTIHIDVTRPCLVEIGNNVRIDTGTTILTHDYTTYVFKNLYSDYVGSSGKVIIGDNVYFAQNCTVLKGVTIGDNCIIGLGSIVNKDIPPNSVAVGRPAKVVSSTNDYYLKRKEKQLSEAVCFVQEFIKVNHKNPDISDLREEFPLFYNMSTTNEKLDKLAKFQMGNQFLAFQKNNKPLFSSYDEFIQFAKKS